MKIQKTAQDAQRYAALFDGILFMLLFFYFHLRVDAKLFYQAQTPVFFFDKDFLFEFLSYPGGIVEYVSQFLTQFFYYAWTGSLLVAILFMAVVWLVRIIFNRITTNAAPIIFSLFPILPLAVLYQNYDFEIPMLVGFIFALVASVFYLAAGPQKIGLRIFVFALFFIIFYYAAAGPALLFVFIAGLYEIVHYRSWLSALLYCGLAFMLPLLCSHRLFIVSKEMVFLLNTGFLTKQEMMWPVYLQWTIFPAIVLALLVYKNMFPKTISIKNSAAKPEQFGLVWFVGQGIVFLILLGLFLQFAFRHEHKKLLLVDYYARHRQWNDILTLAQKGLPESNIVQYQIHRALYFTNRLTEAMFYFPQKGGKDGLFIQEDFRQICPLQYSDLFYDLALVNEAQHWAHEALSVNGDHPWILQRLVQVNMLKGEFAVARKCLLMLEKTIWFRAWTNEYLQYLDNAQSSWPTELLQKKHLMPVDDFLITPSAPELVLEELLAANPQNKMAYEYFMAYCLLDGKVGRMMKYVHQLTDFDYQGIPKHIEEAIILYIANTGRKDLELPKLLMSKATYEQFQQVTALMQKYKGDKNAAFRDFLKFNNTYWYYATYTYKKDQGE